jgi:formiminoglutamase
MFNHYLPIKADSWTGRVDDTNDPDAFRWHQAVTAIDLNQPLVGQASGIHFCILGFCCDEGVIRNLGRPGAHKGPNSIRNELANLPATFLPRAQLFDAGNIHCKHHDLEAAQEDLSQAIHLLLSKGYFPLVLGGGHELALGHYHGITKHLKSQKSSSTPPAIINFDAHLDMRPFHNGGTSGTMFNQIHHWCKINAHPFRYMCLGLQSYANTKSLFKQADSFGTNYLMAKDITANNQPSIVKALDKYIQSSESIYLTLCMDVFSAAHAPGVSAVQPFGLEPDLVLQLIKHILHSGKICSFDIAEVSPRFDSDNRTAKLAAVIIYAITNTLVELKKANLSI